MSNPLGRALRWVGIHAVPGREKNLVGHPVSDLPGGGAGFGAGPNSQPSLPHVNGNPGYQSMPSSGFGAPQGGGGFGDTAGKIWDGAKWVVTSLLPKNADGSIDVGKSIELGLLAGSIYEQHQRDNRTDKLNDASVKAGEEAHALRLKRAGDLRANRVLPTVSSHGDAYYTAMFDDGNPYKKRGTLPSVGSRAIVRGG